jgi:hypothetical protein
MFERNALGIKEKSCYCLSPFRMYFVAASKTEKKLFHLAFKSTEKLHGSN